MLTLRPYQERGCSSILETLEEVMRMVAVAPTGSGKSVIAAWIIEHFVKQGLRCMFLAHRKELIDQISAILDVAGVPHGVIMAGHWRNRPEEPVQVASIDSLMSMRACPSCKNKPELAPTCNVCCGTGKERSRSLPEAQVIIIDEAHRAMGPRYQALIGHYHHAKILLITATPWRLDGKGLGSIVNRMIVLAEMHELIAQKHLLPIRIFRGPSLDLSGIRIQNGDYQADDAAALMRKSKLMGNVIEHYLDLAQGQRGVAFACNVAHSKDLTRRFVEAGVAAEHLDGEMKEERTAILQRFASGQTRVVCNVDVLTEGYDLPALHCVMLVRPTKSITRYLQWVGRGMRPFEDQKYCLVLDHAGCRREHGRPDDFHEWSLEDRRATGRGKNTKGVAEPEACRVCGLDLVRKICARCSPQLFEAMFKEHDVRLVEDRAEPVQISMDLPTEPVRKARDRGQVLCSRCRTTWVSVSSGKTVKVTCRKCIEQEERQA